MIRTRRARIVATLGPASSAPQTVLALAGAGVDVFRLNFSHGSHDDHQAAFDAVRAAEAAIERPLGVLADLQGPKLRLGDFENGEVTLDDGQPFRLDLDPALGDERRVCLPHREIFAVLKPGIDLLIDDGRARLRVIDCGPDFAETHAVGQAALSNHKGVNLPGAVLPISALTAKDREDLAFALRIGVDWVALSFVQRAADMAELRKLVGRKAAVLAKIEKPAALGRLDEILDLCDGIMVARGDLGVEMEPEDVPVVQKRLIRAARLRGIPVIVATQMMESMRDSPTPTRAETSDVAGAVYEGADAMMLSAETAAGHYPLQSVAMMAKIIARVENDPHWPDIMDAEHGGAIEDDPTDSMVAAARRAADAASTACLVAYTATGQTALRLARRRPLQPTLALTPDINVSRRLTLVWGVEPRVAPHPDNVEDMTDLAVAMAAKIGLAAPGQRLLILAGLPFGRPGSANLLRLAHVPR
ncbi:pyruvate kinase [soil metagenome]